MRGFPHSWGKCPKDKRDASHSIFSDRHDPIPSPPMSEGQREGETKFSQANRLLAVDVSLRLRGPRAISSGRRERPQVQTQSGLPAVSNALVRRPPANSLS